MRDWMVQTPENISANPATRTLGKGASPVLVCDVPVLHPEVSAYPTLGGGMTIQCPFCGKLHLHGGTGHRLAHCADPRGRGYVLVPAVSPAPWAARQPSGEGARP